MNRKEMHFPRSFRITWKMHFFSIHYSNILLFSYFVLYRWRDFNRSMFWLAVISGSLVLLHVFLLIILKLRKKSCVNQRNYGALTFPKFEIFLVILALPCICEASAALIKGCFLFLFLYATLGPGIPDCNLTLTAQLY